MHKVHHVSDALSAFHVAGDTRISVNQTRELADLGEEMGANITVWLPEGVGHVDSVFKFPDEYERRLVDFFTSALR